MKEILVLGSHCMKSSYYRDVVQKIVDEMKLEIHGVEVGCSNSYCPGCNFVNLGKEEKYTPALVIDGKLVAYSSFPSQEEFIALLNEAMQE